VTPEAAAGLARPRGGLDPPPTQDVQGAATRP
jgi:hypothetical protein